MKIDVKPIGIISNSVKGVEKGDDWKTVVSEIIIDKAFEEALDQIEGFSHVIVLYWMHQITPSKRSVLKVHPRKRQDLPLVGVLATRSPARPNPIGMTTVKLLECRKNILKVVGLDAMDGSPVIDIKPYIPGPDSPTEAGTPDWITKLQSPSENK